MCAIKRRVHTVMTPPQLGLFGEERIDSGRRKTNGGVRFEHGDVRELFIGEITLGSYLKQAGQTLPALMEEVLSEVDFSALEGRYKAGGRPAYHPAPMVGLVLYGLLKGKRSLRELEELARLDLGCIYVCRGLAPDHASLGRFINLHEESLTGAFLEETTARILSRGGSRVSHLAGDGTILQACASRLGLLKEEAARQMAEERRAAAEAAPGDEEKAREAAQAAAAHALLLKRKKAREERGKKTDALKVSPTEPEAAVQKMKDGRVLPCYKASVVATPERFIVGQAVDPTREIDVVEAMLAQAQRVGSHLEGSGGSARCEQLLVDGGYLGETVLALAVTKDIDLLCAVERGSPEAEEGKTFPKSRFQYDAEADTYQCPAGALLRPRGSHTSKGQTYVAYTTPACRTCPLKASCTRTKEGGRKIKRFGSDEAKAALARVMAHPLARARYRKRQAWVEPVFSTLRGPLRFNRFNRRGLKAVGLEFALNALAYNFHRLGCLLRKLARPGTGPQGADGGRVLSPILWVIYTWLLGGAYRRRGTTVAPVEIHRWTSLRPVMAPVLFPAPC